MQDPDPYAWLVDEVADQIRRLARNGFAPVLIVGRNGRGKLHVICQAMTPERFLRALADQVEEKGAPACTPLQ